MLQEITRLSPPTEITVAMETGSPDHYSLATVGRSTNQTNYTAHSTSEDTSFFGAYYAEERFAAECVVAFLAFICNVVALVLTKGYYYQHHAYHTFFKNMVTANALSILGMWMTNNTMYLFLGHLDEWDLCNMLLLLFSLNQLATVFALASGMTIMGFGIIHYMAICWSEHYDKYLTQNYVRIAVAFIWLFAILFSVWPVVALIVSYSERGCSLAEVEWYTIISMRFVIAVICICYLTLAGLCLRIYWEIHQLQQLLSLPPWAEELQYEKRAWRTIAFLLSTMTVFCLPFYVLHMVSLHTGRSLNQAHPALVYYMNLLPYIKYSVDPLIYGRRMLGLGDRLRSRLRACCRCALKAKESSRSTHTTRQEFIRKARFERVKTKV